MITSVVIVCLFLDIQNCPYIIDCQFSYKRRVVCQLKTRIRSRWLRTTQCNCPMLSGRAGYAH